MPCSASALSCGTRPPAPPRPCHGRPTRQPSVSERTGANAEVGGRGGGLPPTARALPSVAENRKKTKIPRAQHEYEPNASVKCYAYCCTAVAHGCWAGWWMGGLVGGSVGSGVGRWVVSYVSGCFRDFFWFSFLLLSAIPACSGEIRL